MVSVNLYTNLSTVDCNPVKFSILGNQFTTSPVPIVFSNGIRANIDEFLNNCISFTTNNKTGLFLTDIKKASDFLTDDLKPKDIGSLTEIDSPIVGQNLIKSPVADHNLEILTLLKVQDNYQWAVTGVSSFNQDDVFRFVFQPDNSLIVESAKTKYLLTSLFEGHNGLIFHPVITPILSSKNFYIDAQRFDYALGPDTISLFQINDDVLLPRFQNAVVKFNSGFYGLSSLSYLTSADKFPKEAALNFISYKEKPSLNSDIKDSFLVKYKVNPLNNQNTLTLDLSTVNTQYSQNYLGIFPPEYYIQTTQGVTYPLALHGLKNYQTPEYNYSFGHEYVQGQKGIRRKYENVYSGTNQDKGLDNVYLGFTSDTIEMDFPPDKDSPFYFGPTSERIPLSSSGLIEDGAIPGETPFASDRIYIKLQDYSEKIPDSPQPPSITRYSNTWLCSWLSGSMDGNKVWMDRYYNPAYYTIDQALSTKLMVYHDRLNTTENYTFDMPSQMYLEPGALYRYFHTGKENRLNFIQHLSSNSILQVTKWDSSPLMDESPNQGEGILYFNKESNLLGDSLNLDGTNHVLFPATTELLTQNQLTVSMWLNTQDWQNMSGKQIFGNYYDSGFGLINEGSLTTPIITLADSNDTSGYKNKIYNLNYKFSNLENLTAQDLSFSKGNKIVQRLIDYTYWVFDTKGLAGIKYDINNQPLFQTNYITNAKTHLVNSLSSISQIETDKYENLYLFDNTSKNYVVLDTNGNYKSNGSLSKDVNSIQIDLNGNMISCFGLQSAIDNQNNIWEIIGGNLYRNKAIFGNIGYVQQIIFDADNYIWILHGQDSLTKINVTNNQVVFSKRLGKYSTLPVDPCFDYTKQSRFMNFVRVPKDSNSDPCNTTLVSTEDRLILVDLNDNNIYTINSSGNIITKLNLIGLTNNLNVNMLSYGDFTGYQYLRKYASINKQLSWKLKLATPNGKNPSPSVNIKILPYDINNLSPGWHHFTLAFDGVNGTIKAYLDSVQQGNTATFTPHVYQLYYIYRTSLLLGCETIQNTTLNDIIAIDNGYKFTGQVAELRLYNKSLTQGEIEQLYFSSKHAADDRSLLWNMSVGERNYIEQIKHWYKMQLPGNKSKYYNINIHNLNVPDQVKQIIESGIKNNLNKIAPTNTSLYKINWK